MSSLLLVACYTFQTFENTSREYSLGLCRWEIHDIESTVYKSNGFVNVRMLQIEVRGLIYERYKL